jgi:type I restriction enzyme S subunit
MRALAITSAGLYSLSVRKIQQIAIPLPPLAEQRRIVAKVRDLMAVCNELELALASVQKDRSRLLEALLHEALNGAGELPGRLAC